MLSDDFPEFCGGQSRTPEALGATPVTLHIQVPDADAAFARAVEAGATVIMPPADMFWGDRYGRLKDPMGHEWSISTPQRQVSAEEMAEAAKPFFEKK
jgi:PhnB protein